MRDIPLSPAANSKVATELPHPAKHSRTPPQVVVVKNLICLELYFRDSFMCRFTAVKKKTDFRSDA